MDNKDENRKKIEEFLTVDPHTPRGIRFVINNISKYQEDIRINSDLVFRQIRESDIRGMIGTFENEFGTKNFKMEDLYVFEHSTKKYNAHQEHDILKFACSILETPILLFAEYNELTTFDSLHFEIFSIVNRESKEKDYRDVELKQLADILTILENENIPEQIFSSLYFYVNAISSIIDKEFKFVSLTAALESLLVKENEPIKHTIAKRLASLHDGQLPNLDIEHTSHFRNPYKLFKNLYEIRSEIAHGNRIGMSTIIGNHWNGEFQVALNALNKIVRKSILKSIFKLGLYRSVYNS